MAQAAARALVVAGAAVTAARLGPSDRWLATALLAYVPAVGVLAGALAALGLLVRAGRPPAGWTAGAVALATAGAAAVAADNRRLLAPPAPPPAGHTLRVLHWNVARRPGDPGLIAREQPDVVLLSEAWRVQREALGGGWRVVDEEDLLVLSRHALERRGLWRGPGVRALHVVVGTEPPLSLVLADVVSSPLVSRRAALEALAAALPGMVPAPDVVAGDLNTPAHAASLRSTLRRGYLDAYLEAGRGLGYTWPAFLPAMRIDHALVRPGVGIAGYRTGASWRSDHRWQLLAVAPPGPPRAAVRGSADRGSQRP